MVIESAEFGGKQSHELGPYSDVLDIELHAFVVDFGAMCLFCDQSLPNQAITKEEEKLKHGKKFEYKGTEHVW